MPDTGGLSQTIELEASSEVLDSKSKAPYKFETHQVGFRKRDGSLEIKIGNVRLTDTSIEGSFETDDGEYVELDVDFAGCRHWGDPNSPSERVTMGLASRIPFIPLKWHVSSLDGAADGRIDLGQRSVALNDARVHFEKNWGKAFPKQWIWMQANEFGPNVDVAFVGAGGLSWIGQSAQTVTWRD